MKSEDIIKATRNSLNIYSFTAEALEKLIAAIQSEHKCQTCEALARTVMMDQTAHDTHTAPQRKWVGLMRGVRVDGDTVVITVKGGNESARQLCAELLKEKNT
jgi:type II secretory pathway component PulK